MKLDLSDADADGAAQSAQRRVCALVYARTMTFRKGALNSRLPREAQGYDGNRHGRAGGLNPSIYLCFLQFSRMQHRQLNPGKLFCWICLPACLPASLPVCLAVRHVGR